MIIFNNSEKYNSIHCVQFRYSKRGKLCLLEMVGSFPPLSATIVRTYFELLLQLEVVLQLQRPINVVSFFPTWLRSALKKGAFKVRQM